MFSFVKALLCIALMATMVALFSGENSYAQQVFGSILGTITDPSGSAVVNATITVTDVNKGTSSTTTTNDSGNYTKGQLIPGTYRVTVEAAGFSKAVSTDIIVQVDQASQFNAALQVGDVKQEVEVTAAAPLLQTDRADVAQTLSSEQISQLPSIGRNLQSFELLNPGTAKLGWQHASDEDPQGSIQTIVNGQLFDSTGYYLDGTINQDPILGIIVINPTFDSVNEVKQSNQDYDAEFGYTGAGLFTYSTKSGTNQFHGDAFEFLYLNTPGFQDFGRNPFNNAEATGAPTTRQNQFGGSIGGRIIKDKLFFFGDAQLERQSRGGSVLTTVPTAQDRTGNLSDWLAASPLYQAYDPSTGDPQTGLGRKAYAGNIIPQSELNPQALALLNYFPQPNTTSFSNGVALPYNNYSDSGNLTLTANQWDTRWDYYLSAKDTIFGRYSYAQYIEQAPGAFGTLAGGPAFSNANYAGSSNTLNQSISAGWTHTINPTLVNEFRFGYMRYHVNDVPNGFGTQPATAAGIPGENLDNTFTSGLPAFYIQQDRGGILNASNMTLGYSLGANQCNCPLNQLERQQQYVDNVSKIHGNHNFKFGVDARYAQNLRVPSDNHRAGENYFFSDNTANVTQGTNGSTVVTDGLALATFLLGDVTQFNRYVSSSVNAQEHQKRGFLYAQDEWRITPKLTLTYGVRWELVAPEGVNVGGNGAELNVNTGQMDVFGLGHISIHGFQKMNWDNFAPRASIAYQLTPKTVIRAGYGWAYSLGVFGNNFGHNVTQNPPVLANQSLSQNNTCGTAFCTVFSLSQGPPAFNPANYQGSSYVPNPQTGTFTWPGTTISAFTRPQTLTMPTFYLYNFTVQRQITNKISVSGGYVGNSGRHSLLGTDQNFNINQPMFVPGGPATGVFPFAGGLGSRYNYGWTAAVNDFCNCANSQYNSFQALINVRAFQGWTLTGNYTYQDAMGDGYGGNEAYTFLYDRPLGYGESPNMPHQQWTLANVYEIPFGKGRRYGTNSNRLVDSVLGGWNLSAIYTYYSGFPFMPTLDNYPGQPTLAGGNIPNNRPDRGSGSPYSSNQNRNSWIVGISPSGGPYTAPAAGAFGNYPINTLIGPMFNNVDASLQKSFAITERFKFTLRVDTTNTLNHTNLGQPNADIQSPSVGQITQTAQGGNYNMRRLQYSGSISW